MATNETSFRPGQSGNPTGRAKGSRNRASLTVDELLEGQAEKLTQAAIDKALEGDTTALRLCLDRLAPARRDRVIQFELPPIAEAADAVKAQAALVAAVAEGELSPGEAADLAKLVEGVTRAIEVTDLAARIAKLEDGRP